MSELLPGVQWIQNMWLYVCGIRDGCPRAMFDSRKHSVTLLMTLEVLLPKVEVYNTSTSGTILHMKLSVLLKDNSQPSVWIIKKKKSRASLYKYIFYAWKYSSMFQLSLCSWKCFWLNKLKPPRTVQISCPTKRQSNGTYYEGVCCCNNLSPLSVACCCYFKEILSL